MLQRKLEPFAQERGLDPIHLEPLVNRMDSSKELQAALIDPEGFLVDRMRSDDPAGQRLRKKTIMVTTNMKCVFTCWFEETELGFCISFSSFTYCRWRCASTFSSAICFLSDKFCSRGLSCSLV